MEGLIPNGEPAPDFSLPDLGGKVHALRDYRGLVLVVNFWSAECPWSRRADGMFSLKLTRMNPEVALLSIASNANERVESLDEEAARRGVSPLLLDPDRVVADLYSAQTTPHYFVIDRMGFLRFQGAPDSATFRQREATREYLIPAIEAVLAGKTPDPEMVLPYGCSILRFPTD